MTLRLLSGDNSGPFSTETPPNKHTSHIFPGTHIIPRPNMTMQGLPADLRPTGEAGEDTPFILNGFHTPVSLRSAEDFNAEEKDRRAVLYQSFMLTSAPTGQSLL